jgi:sugar phosphate isomerase/epimerase
MKLKWAFASASVMNLPWDDEFKLWKKFKWRAVELWFDKVKACMEKGRTCAELGRRMYDEGITPIGMAPAVLWTPGEGHDPRHEREELLERMDVTAALGCQSLAIIILGKPGHDLAEEHKRLVGKLRGVADMAAARHVRLCLEFVAGLPVNGTLGSCIELVTAADHPGLGMLFDLCHYYTSASHLEELSLLPKKKLFHIHVDDSQKRPMEVLGSEHRAFPGEGRIDVPGLLTEIRRRTKYDGYYSLELYDKDVWAMDPKKVFKASAESIKLVQRKM